MAKRGRPPKAASERRDQRLVLKVTAAELKAVKKAAGKRSFTAWARDMVLRALGRK